MVLALCCNHDVFLTSSTVDLQLHSKEDDLGQVFMFA